MPHTRCSLKKECGGKAIDAFLGIVVEDLDDFFREEHVAAAVGEHGVLGGGHRHLHVEAAGAEKVFLGEILAVNLMVGHGVGLVACGCCGLVRALASARRDAITAPVLQIWTHGLLERVGLSVLQLFAGSVGGSRCRALGLTPTASDPTQFPNGPDIENHHAERDGYWPTQPSRRASR